MSEDQGISILNEMQVILLALTLFVLVLIVMKVLSRFSNKIKEKLADVLKKTFWNGMILSFDMQCMLHCITIGNQLRVLTTHSGFIKEKEVISAGVLLCFLIFLIIFMVCYLKKKLNRLDSKDMKNLCGNLYVLPLKGKIIMPVIRLPISFAQRLIYMVLAGAFYDQPYFSLQFFVFFNLFYTMYRIQYKLDAPYGKQMQQHFSDVAFHLMILLLFLFTDFVTLDGAQLIYSLIYISIFGLICLVNIAFITFYAAKDFLLRRKRQRILKIMKAKSLRM